MLLESRASEGRAYIRDEALWVRRLEDPDSDAPCGWPRGRVPGAAAGLSRELQQRAGGAVWVEPVVVLWCPFDEGVFFDSPCTFIHGSKLRQWLENRPERLSGPRVSQLATAVGELATTRN